MALEFGNLHPLRRGKDLFYCLLEVRRNLFSLFSEEYFNNCVRGLGIETFVCNEEETSFIRNFLPAEIGPFFLISESNLLRLNQILLSSRQIAYQRANFGYQFSPVATTTIPSSNFLPDTEFGSWTFPARPAQAKLTDSATCVSNEDPGNEGLESVPKLPAVESDGTHLAIKPSEDSPSEDGDISSVAQASASTSNSRENKKSFTLTDEEMSPQLRSDFGEIRKFYSVELNADRDGYAMQDVTIAKMFERICRFLWFLRNVKSVEPRLSCCSDPQLIQEFVNYTMKVRSVKAITCSRYLTAFINVAKVPFISNAKQDQNDSLEKIRAIQRQLERLARRERVDELAKKPQLEKIVYPELLELCRELKWEVQEKSGQSQARSCMNLCLLLLYCSANPGRSKEYISLRIFKGQSDEECKSQNFICFNEDDTVVLWESDYKTKNTYGVNRTDLTPLSFLTYYLKLYCNKLRQLLLNGKEHDFFFVNARGDAFTHQSYNIYVSAIFEQYFSLKLTTVDIRKAVVNHFLSLPQSGDLALRESFATLMKHSLRTQQRFYDERPLAAKKRRALDFLSSMAARGIEEDGVQIIEDEDSDGNIEVSPLPGEFVALVAANSSRSNPEVFLAKVLRLSEDHKTAFLAEFSEIEAGKFKLNPGKSYREALAAVIYPVDVVYLQSNGLYELRTPKIDLHNQLPDSLPPIMAGMTSLLADERLFQVLKEIDVIPQLFEEFVTSSERTAICLPFKNYSRSFSFNFLAFTSEFYCGLLRRSLPERACNLCSERHGQNFLCLPNFVHPASVDLLLDILEWKRINLSFEEDLVSLVRLCGYLLIKSNILHAFLVSLLPLDEVRASKTGAVFAYELYWNGFLDSSEYFSQGVDHPCFYGLLTTYPSFRDIKRKVRSFDRFRTFARTYTYPSGRVRFSKVRAAFYWNYFQPPESLESPDGW